MRIITDSDRTIRVIGINNKQVIEITDNDTIGFIIEYETKDCKRQFKINCHPVKGVIINDKVVRDD